MEPTTLQILWFGLLGVLLAGYAVLDGFDLGVGTLSLTRRDPEDRRLMINAIGPVWDGNEVWLITAGGALFAAFPPVYATAFSSLYLAMMLLLVALIARAVSIEFRGKVESPAWRRAWDLSFGLGSLLATLLLGVAAGNVMLGLPLEAGGRFTGDFLGLLNPFALAIGLTAVAMFVTHGAVYMVSKAEGALAADMRAWARRAWIAWVALYVLATALAFFAAPRLFERALGFPPTWAALVLVFCGLALVPVFLRAGRPGRAFVASAAAVAGQVVLVGLGLYPRLLPSSSDPAHDLTIANASSSALTLTVMLVIALAGMPLVLAYQILIHRVFRGKVRLDEDSY
jgi:cytochrome d ubiquinol oxidase subunit II